MITLRPYQKATVNELRSAYALGAKAPLMVAPTGSGKTVTFAYIAENAAARGKRVLILVHRKELLTQTSATLRAFDVTHGIIAAGIPSHRRSTTDYRVKVASVNTLVHRMARMSWRPDLIIVDEAHHATGKTMWGRILRHYSSAMVLGCTATPERLDGQGLGITSGGFFDYLALGPSVQDLVSDGHLSQPVVYAPSRPDLSAVHTRAGDFMREEIARAIDKPTITGDAVAHYRKHCNREPAIAFCVSIGHATHTAETFLEAGFQAASIDGTLDDATRAARIRDLGNGALNVLTSCDIVSEGTDIPIVSAAILLRPTQSLGLYLQQVGRVLRPFPGKQRAVILDHVGNVYRHGLPDDDREWSLGAPKRSKRGAKGEDQEISIRQCDECYHVHKSAPACPECGYVYPVQAREIEEVDGDLEQVDPVAVRRERERENRAAKTRADLEAIARIRGYKAGWVDRMIMVREQYRNKYRGHGRRAA